MQWWSLWNLTPRHLGFVRELQPAEVTSTGTCWSPLASSWHPQSCLIICENVIAEHSKIYHVVSVCTSIIQIGLLTHTRWATSVESVTRSWFLWSYEGFRADWWFSRHNSVARKLIYHAHSVRQGVVDQFAVCVVDQFAWFAASKGTINY